MSKIVQKLDHLQKDRIENARSSNAVEEPSSKEPSFSKFGIILWLSASITATVFSYQLGLHQGMQAVKNESPRQWLYYFNEAAEKNFAAAQSENVKTAATAVAEIPLAAVSTEPKAEVSAAAEEIKKSGFTIQVVTYKSQVLAKQEVERLRKKGHEAFAVSSGDYHQVCIDLFDNRKLAMQKLIKLRTEQYYKIYPGAYVRFLKG